MLKHGQTNRTSLSTTRKDGEQIEHVEQQIETLGQQNLKKKKNGQTIGTSLANKSN